MTTLAPERLTNSTRARRARQTLTYYKENCLVEGGPVGKEDVTDILTDLRHLCDSNNWGYASVDRRAREHFMYERLV